MEHGFLPVSYQRETLGLGKAMKTERFPLTVNESGVSAKIRKFTQTKKVLRTFLASYFLRNWHRMDFGGLAGVPS